MTTFGLEINNLYALKFFARNRQTGLTGQSGTIDVAGHADPASLAY